MFGEIDALCCRPQAVTYRTKTLSQLLKMKTSALIEEMQSKQEDYVAILKNFLQHHKRLKELNIGDLIVDSGNQEDDNPYMSINLLTVVSTGNAAFLDELLKARLDLDIGDSKGRTPLHIAASKGHEECVLVLLKHACNIHLRDVEGNTAMWDAIAAKHHSIFRILYHWASISDPCTAGYLLTTDARRNDVAVMKELLKHGLVVDSKDCHGLTHIQIAMEENHSEMGELLVMNGADVNTEDVHKSNNKVLSSLNLDEMLQKREVGHQISMLDSVVDKRIVKKLEDEDPAEEIKKEKSSKGITCSIRVIAIDKDNADKDNTDSSSKKRTRGPTLCKKLKRELETYFNFNLIPS
ncbi:hypothetical protein AgCh_019501 [Apium graveolens]